MEHSRMKVVLTGGSNGIGSAVARLLSLSGHEVHSIDREAPAQLSAHCHYKADVTDATSLQIAFERIGPDVDVLFNNAGIMRRGRLFDSSEQDFDELFSANVKGAWMTMRASLPFLKANATLLQMSSGHATDPPLDPALYALTKQFAANFAAAVEKDRPQTVVKTIYPGPVDTPLGRYGLTEDEIAKKTKIMHDSNYVATWIVRLLESPTKRSLRFDDESWDYDLI